MLFGLRCVLVAAADLSLRPLLRDAVRKVHYHSEEFWSDWILVVVENGDSAWNQLCRVRTVLVEWRVNLFNRRRDVVFDTIKKPGVAAVSSPVERLRDVCFAEVDCGQWPFVREGQPYRDVRYQL